jgi:AcrR family transcriptional regulator
VAARSRSRPGRRPRSADSAGREQLLDAAIAVFAERGIANTTVAQIAAAGRVTSAMVHYWFDTRERLLDAVADERLAPLIHQVWGPVKSEEDPVELVRGLVMRLFDLTDKAPWLGPLWLREIVQEGGQLRERVLKRIPAEPNAALRRSIIRGQERGEINPQIVPGLIFISMFALVMLPQAAARLRSSIRLVRRFNPDLILDRPSLERHVMALLLRGISA